MRLIAPVDHEISGTLHERLHCFLSEMDLEAVEVAACSGTLPPILEDEWAQLRASVGNSYRQFDFAVLRNLPLTCNGAALILAVGLIGQDYRTYRGGRVLKKFVMSPWTQDLSHTLAEGHFHTDLNTAPRPPALTAIFCEQPDPGAPQYGVNRVARLGDILDELRDRGCDRALNFLLQDDVKMANDRSENIWSGRIVNEGKIRFHPETVLAACRRFGHSAMGDILADIHSASFKVSYSIQLNAGDGIIVSNERALHYRGECSVIFRNFPKDFLSRSVYVLHAARESLDE